MVPERFALEDVNPAAAHPKTSFKGALFLGHFERGGTVLADNVTVTVAGVPHFRRFDPHPPKLPELEYFSFGSGAQRHLAHLVTRAPDFDQILTVEISDESHGDIAEVPASQPLTVPGRKNTVDQRILAGQTVTGVVGDAQAGAKVSVVAQAEVYLETDDLA